MNPMNEVVISKATINIGVGEAGEKLSRAMTLIENMTGQTPVFDAQGNVSFGIREHIDIPGMRYDPDIGIFGMNLSITFEKPGYRIKRRKIQKKSIPKRHRITPEETMKFMEEKFNVTIAEEEDYE